jgi:hypothetical protein
MSAFLDPIRSAIPATVREKWYVTSGAIITFLVGWKLLDQSTASAWTQLAIATITLFFAVLYSTSTLRTALYGVLLAVQALAQVYGILSGSQWAAIVALAATLLGTATAAAKTPTTIDGEVVSVRDTEL